MEPEDLREQLRNTPFEQLQHMLLQKLAGYQPVAPGIIDVVPFLQALVEFAPSPAGQHEVAVGISSCSTNLCLEKLAQRYWYGLIMPMRARRETPPPSDHPSRPSASFDAAANAWLVEPSKCDRLAMRELVLHRENYRCAITGRVDSKAVEAGNTERQHGDIPSRVYYAHILPFSLVPGSTEEVAAINQSSTIWQVISGFSGLSLDELNGNNNDRPSNGIALDPLLHRWLGNLSLCFEPTLQLDTYIVRYWNGALIWGLPNTVSFVSRSGIPVPDPRYLALHAACAKVVHSSGMAKILNKLIEDLEVTNVLSSDGSSAHLLHHALMKIAFQ